MTNTATEALSVVAKRTSKKSAKVAKKQASRSLDERSDIRVSSMPVRPEFRFVHPGYLLDRTRAR